MKRLTSRWIGTVAVCLLSVGPVTTARAQTTDELAAKGAALAQADPLAAELRKRTPDGPMRRGFDIGMAVVQGHTAPGPGKDKLRDSLPLEERGGFNTAVAFSLEQNRNAALGVKLTEQFVDMLARGEAIAREDALVAVGRSLLESDDFYRLGFDIATAIFGDPALGANGNTVTGPGSQRIRDALNATGQRGFNAAVKFHLARDYKRAAPAVPDVAISTEVLNALAVKGEPLANADPLSAELRKRQTTDAGRRGFDIGMATAEGNTVPGPGKQRIGESLLAAERGAFDTAVGFSLERNRNAEFARVGAAIAKADPTVEKARTADPAVLYWLGFDIATGLFGDPALGAKGNTATGPGSFAIRDALSAAGQRGFNAAVTLHLSRNYKKP